MRQVRVQYNIQYGSRKNHEANQHPRTTYTYMLMDVPVPSRFRIVTRRQGMKQQTTEYKMFHIGAARRGIDRRAYICTYHGGAWFAKPSLCHPFINHRARRMRGRDQPPPDYSR